MIYIFIIIYSFISCKNDPYQSYRNTISEIVDAIVRNDYPKYKKLVFFNEKLTTKKKYKEKFTNLKNVINKFKNSDFTKINFKEEQIGGEKIGIIGNIVLVEKGNPQNGYAELSLDFTFLYDFGNSQVAQIFIMAIPEF